tara:strand:+ start:1052 stop:1531 length:480 start_codon:yes stop_codon:yes gene_type:complete
MELKDSKKEKLSYNQVLFGAIGNAKSSGQMPEDVSMKDAVATVVQEIGSKNVQTVQIGNSIFLGVRDENRSNMYVRVYNMDVGRNVIDNMYNYGAYVQKQGIKHMSAQIRNERLLPALRVLQKRLEKLDTNLEFVELENRDGYGMFVKFGKQPLQKEAA